ncbi:alpha/beta fold hydrolase [Streptomyces albus]|uniref:alpha/beta fold hydrolase n=1 Tax=Streptomyces albus TaxID=1888 RepID=UPI00099B5843|nr:alpha/beta hydrolase [Streptomyces albus]
MTQQAPPGSAGPAGPEEHPRGTAHRFTAADGTPLTYHVYGTDTATPGTPPVVLHHGFVADTFVNWVAPGIAGALTARGHRVVGLDARGHGRSGKPHDPAAYGEAAMARDLRQLFDVLGADRVHLAGYSMGAVVSLLAAVEDERVTRLVVGGVGAGVVEVGGLDTRALPPGSVIAALTAEDPSTVPAEAAGFRALADAVGADRAALAAHAAAVHRAALPLSAITASTLVIAGDEDPLAVRPAVLADAIPGARLHTVPGDHLTAVRDPGFVSALTGFLAGDRPGPAGRRVGVDGR